MTDIGGGWYMEKSARGLTPLRRTKLSKKSQERQDEIQKNYMKLISCGMIGNSNCIGTNLNGLILNITPEIVKPFSVSSKTFYIDKSDRTAHFVGYYVLKE